MSKSPSSAAHPSPRITCSVGKRLRQPDESGTIHSAFSSAATIQGDCEGAATCANAYEWAKPTDTNRTVVEEGPKVYLYVPTLFTTAAGRPIAVCELRGVDPQSAHGRLLLSPHSSASLCRDEILPCTEGDTDIADGNESAAAQDSDVIATDASNRGYLVSNSCSADGWGYRPPWLHRSSFTTTAPPTDGRAASCPPPTC